MANVIISNAVDTFLQSNNVGEMQTNLDLATYLASPPAIGGTTAATGRFTELRIGTPTKPPLIIGNYDDVTGTGGDNATIWATASPTISNYIFTATDTTTFFNSAENLSFRTDGVERLFIDDNSIKPLVPFRPLTDSTSAIQFQNATGNETTASIDTTNRVFKAWTFVAGNSAPAALSDQHFYVTRSSGDPTQVYVRDGNSLAQIRGGGNATDAGIRITNGNSLNTWMEINGTDVEIVPPLKLTDGRIRPDLDSTSAIRIQSAAGSALATFDTVKDLINFNNRQVEDCYLAGAHFEGGFVGYQPIIDRLTGANMRYTIATTGNFTDLDNLWDISNETRAIIPAGETSTIEVDFRNADVGSTGFTFANGMIAVTPYHTSVPETLTIEIERNYNSTPEWVTIATLTNIQDYRAAVVDVNQHTFIGKIRFTITAQSSQAAELVKIQYFASRSNDSEPARSLQSRKSGVQKSFTDGIKVANADESNYSELRQGWTRTTPLTVASLPSSPGNGSFAFVSDGTRPNRPVYNDGTNWRYFSDDVIVS